MHIHTLEHPHTIQFNEAIGVVNPCHGEPCLSRSTLLENYDG